MFTDIAKENKKNMVNSETAFDGKRKVIKEIIKERYDAEYVDLGITGFFKDTWMQVSIHNGRELDEEEELILARAVYRMMDTSLVKNNYIMVSQSYKNGFIITRSGAIAREYYFHELDPNIPDQELEDEDRNKRESWHVGF